MAAYPQSATYTRAFLMVQSSDHVTGLTGASPTVTLSKAGAAFAAAGGTVTEIANGWYKIALTTTDTNTLGDLAFHITATSGDPTDFADQVIDAAKGLGAPSNLDATVSSRSTYAGGAVASVTAAVTVGAYSAGEDPASLVLATPANKLATDGSGRVTAGTVSDKTGYSLTQAFPTNFGALVVDVNGRVQVQYGTATGQISATSGIVDANAKQINGSASAASNLAGGLNTVASGTVGSSATTTSIPTSAFSPAGTVSGQFIGRTIVFADNTTTAALQGQAATISGSTNAANPTLTVSALTTAPVSGDTFWIF